MPCLSNLANESDEFLYQHPRPPQLSPIHCPIDQLPNNPTEIETAGVAMEVNKMELAPVTNVMDCVARNRVQEAQRDQSYGA